MALNITHKQEFETLGSGHARVSVAVFVDDVRVGSVVVASGPKRDLEELVDGEITLQELTRRWEPKVRGS